MITLQPHTAAAHDEDKDRMTTQLGLPTAQATLEAYADAMREVPPAMPQLIAHTHETTCVMILANNHPGGIRPMLAGALDHVIDQHGQPTWVTFAAETWITEMPDDNREPAPGELQHRAEHGDPTVSEAVVLYGVAANGDHWAAARPFHRDPNGIAWDGPLRLDGRNHGPILDLLQQATR